MEIKDETKIGEVIDAKKVSNDDLNVDDQTVYNDKIDTMKKMEDVGKNIGGMVGSFVRGVNDSYDEKKHQKPKNKKNRLLYKIGSKFGKGMKSAYDNLNNFADGVKDEFDKK